MRTIAILITDATTVHVSRTQLQSLAVDDIHRYHFVTENTDFTCTVSLPLMSVSERAW